MEVRKQWNLKQLNSTDKKECEALKQYVGMIRDTINARLGIIIARDLQSFK